MVNKCVVTNCTSGYATGAKKQSSLFPEGEDLCKKWIYFANRKNCAPAIHTALYVSTTSTTNL